MKIFKITFLIVVLLIIGIFAAFQVFFRVSLPDYSGTVSLAGLTDPVEVRFDDYGVPHITAQNEHDLFFAQGYITARERMFQMDMTRRAGRGELSVLFGEATESKDKFLKTVGFYRTAKEEYASLPDAYKEMIGAYTDGVNAYINTAKHLPREYVILGAKIEPWLPEDTVVCGTLMAFSLTRSKDVDLLLYQIGEKTGAEFLDEITPSFPDGAPRVSKSDTTSEEHELAFTHFGPASIPFLDAQHIFDMPASNWMIFAPKKTSTGAAILTGSPDLGPTLPSLFYLIHLVGGVYNVIGGSIPGVPLVSVVGFNGDIAWSNVNGRVDELDYFIEKINPENENQYLTENGYRDFEIITETIKVKTKDGFTEEPLTVKISRHGPIVSGLYPLTPENTAMMWVGNEPSGILEGSAKLCVAKNFDDFRKAISVIKTPTLNVAYVDRMGNIGYQYMTSPPIRKKGSGTVPVPGWNGEYDWVGHVPFDQIPYDYNPDKGYFGSFNNEAKPTPFHMTDFYLFERATRFQELISGYETVTLEDVRGFQLDTVSVVAKRWIPRVTAAFEGDKKYSDELSLFDGWDFSINKKSPAATLYNQFYLNLMKNVFENKIGEELWEKLALDYNNYIADMVLARVVNDNENAIFDDISTPDVRETRDDMVRKSFVEAVDTLRDRLGNNPGKWEWGKVHRMTFAHPMGKKLFFFNLSPIPTDGDGFTIGAGAWDTAHPFDMTYGGVIRLIVDFSDIEKSTFISPPGQSGALLSPHYDDTAEIWAEGKQIPLHYLSYTDLKDILVLEPEK